MERGRSRADMPRPSAIGKGVQSQLRLAMCRLFRAPAGGRWRRLGIHSKPVGGPRATQSMAAHPEEQLACTTLQPGRDCSRTGWPLLVVSSIDSQSSDRAQSNGSGKRRGALSRGRYSPVTSTSRHGSKHDERIAVRDESDPLCRVQIETLRESA